jgi:hypothetical protein
MSTSSIPIVVSGSPLSSAGQQSAFPSGDDPRLQYSYPAPQQAPQPYQSYRDPSTSYSNHPTTSPRIEASRNHTRDERWQTNLYGGTPATNCVPETAFSPVASYPGPSFQYQTQHPLRGMRHGPPFSVPINTSTTSSTGNLRRGPVSVERTATRRLCAYHLPPIPTPPPHIGHFFGPPSAQEEEKARQCGAIRVLNEVYARTTYPSTEERKELAVRLNHDPQERADLVRLVFLRHRPCIHISFRFQNKRQSMRNTRRQSTSVRGSGSETRSRSLWIRIGDHRMWRF